MFFKINYFTKKGVKVSQQMPLNVLEKRLKHAHICNVLINTTTKKIFFREII
jgi:hypothetical protein